LSGWSGYSGFSGSGTSGFSGAPAVGITYYPTTSASEFSVYYGLMSEVPQVIAQTSLGYTLSAVNGTVTLGQIVTPIGLPDEQVIGRGTWQFNAYYALTGTNPLTTTTTLIHAIYKRTQPGGTETLLFSAVGDPLSNVDTSNPGLQTTQYTVVTPIDTNVTDRFVY
jgi:hypothetical protein